MEFINVQKDIYLTVDQMNNIYNNFQYLKDSLEQFGLKVGNLVDNSVTYQTSPADFLDKFNNVEKNIQTFHKTLKNLLGKDEKFYKDFVWTAKTINRKSEVWRWIDWMNNVKNIKVFYENLYDAENNVIIDKYGEPIMILSGKE